MKALALVSGGLDSILAARLIMEQSIEVIGVSFESPFFSASSAREASEEIGIRLEVIDIGADLMKVVDAPKHGYGKNMNPCIDCHALMLRRAAILMEELGASFIITGEVIGQRPKSQMRFGLQVVARESGLKGLLLRPLSAKLLAPTVPEREGWVDRDRLLGLHGRTRKPQMELAERYGITRYASPAGGCLLTDENFARALRDLRDHGQMTASEARLLTIGRQFRVSGETKVIVGRNHSENEQLFELRPPDDLLVKAVDRKGPIGVIVGGGSDTDLEEAGRVVARYADTDGEETVRVHIWGARGIDREFDVAPASPREVRGLAI